MASYRIRQSTIADAEALGKLHSQVWRESYSGLLPESVLSDAGSVATRTEKMRRSLAAATSEHGNFLIETDAGHIVGFGDCGPARELGAYAPAEIYRLYLAKEAQGRGLGPRLLTLMLNFLEGKGYSKIAGKIFDANRKSRRFFEHCGGHEVGKMDVVVGGVIFPTTVYVCSVPQPSLLNKRKPGAIENPAPKN